MQKLHTHPSLVVYCVYVSLSLFQNAARSLTVLHLVALRMIELLDWFLLAWLPKSLVWGFSLWGAIPSLHLQLSSE